MDEDMKANELSCKDLMVGDWVRIKITQHNTTVTNIDANSVYTEAAFPIRYDEIEPISLTPEILEKNGFEYFHKNYSSLSYDHPFKLKMTNWPDENGLGGLWTISNIIEIRFVHQLQHALRLCGIEKTIEL